MRRARTPVRFLIGSIAIVGSMVLANHRAVAAEVEPNSVAQRAQPANESVQLATGSALEDPNAQKAAARQHYERAVSLYQSGKLEESLAAFQLAYQLAPNYAVLFNIGQLHSELGNATEAVRALRRYQAEGSGRIGAARTAEVRRVLALNEQRVGQLQLQIDPIDATVLVDGNPWQPSTAPQPLEPGLHVVVVTHDGYHPKVATIRIALRTVESMHLVLDRNVQAAQGPSWLNVECPVPDVAVSIDDEEPLLLARQASAIRVAPGTRRLRFERAGYASRSVEVAAVPEQIVRVDCSLRLLDTPAASVRRATLTIITDAADARIFVDDSPYHAGLIPAGRHRIKVLRGRNLRWESEIELSPGQALTVPIELARNQDSLSQKRELEQARMQRRLAYVTGGAGTVLVAAGLSTVAIGSHQYSEWESKRDQPTRDQSQLASSAVAIQRIEDVGVGLTLLGVICLATSAYLWLTGQAPAAAGQGPIGTTTSNTAAIVQTVW